MSVRVEHGDARDVLATFAPDSIDACVTDPPYHLTSIVKRFAKTGGADGPEAVVEAGRNAYHAGTRYDQNPWPSSMANHELWANGWKQAEEATAMEMGGDGPGEPAEDEAGGRKARRRAA